MERGNLPGDSLLNGVRCFFCLLLDQESLLEFDVPLGKLEGLEVAEILLDAVLLVDLQDLLDRKRVSLPQSGSLSHLLFFFAQEQVGEHHHELDVFFGVDLGEVFWEEDQLHLLELHHDVDETPLVE